MTVLNLICVGLLLGASGCEWVNDTLGIDDDSPVEEICEGLIEKETGVSIDLTPRSPEVDHGSSNSNSHR